MKLSPVAALYIIAVHSLGHAPSANRVNFQQWRRTTRAECTAETKRQYREMLKAGWCCDPPITMGHTFFEASFASSPSVIEMFGGEGMEPCGRTDSLGSIWPTYAIYAKGKVCEITRDQYDSLYNYTDRQLPDGTTYKSGLFSHSKFRSLVNLCGNNQLPLLEEPKDSTEK